MHCRCDYHPPSVVIPGRAKRELWCAIAHLRIHNPRVCVHPQTSSQGVWIPGPRQEARPGMTTDSFEAYLLILATHRARGLQMNSALKTEGAGDPQERAQGRPGARCTRGLVCTLHKRKRTRAYRFSGEPPAFPAQWCYSLYRALPGDRLSNAHIFCC